MRTLVVVFYLVLSATALPHTSLKHRPGENPIDWRSVPPSVYEILYNHETLLTIPEGPPKGVIFVLASCDTFVLVWGFPSHGCKHCVGKPEETLIVYHAIKRGYVVFVIGPLLSGTDNLCFERSWPPDDSVEIAELRRTLRLVLEEHGWWQLPRFFLGTSAGGSAAMILATRFPVQGRNPDIAEKRDLTWPYPPVLLLKAAEDYATYRERIDESMKFFRRQGVHVELIVMERYPIHPHTFGRMLPWVDSAQSVALFEEMREAGIIDEQGFSTAPPYANQTEWDESRDALRKILISHYARDSDRPDGAVQRHMAALWKMFYAAQAVHETRGREMREILDFFERKAVPDMEIITAGDSDLVRQRWSNGDAVADALGGLPGRQGPCTQASQSAATGGR